MRNLGSIDGVVNNAGMFFTKPVLSELQNSTSDPSSAKYVPADTVARAMQYAIEQPADVEIDEVVLRPAAQDF